MSTGTTWTCTVPWMINMLIFCGCVGWRVGADAHVGRETCSRKQAGRVAGLVPDWNRSPRQTQHLGFSKNNIPANLALWCKISAQEHCPPAMPVVGGSRIRLIVPNVWVWLASAAWGCNSPGYQLKPHRAAAGHSASEYAQKCA